MGFGVPGAPMPHGRRGKKRRRKKKSAFRQFMEFVRDLIICGVVVCAIVLVVEAVPYLMKFEPGDTIAYSNSNIFGKVEVFKDAMRHKRGISEMKFYHNGKTVTFTDTNGTLTGIEAEGYHDAGELEADIAEGQRLIDEWGLSK